MHYGVGEQLAANRVDLIAGCARELDDEWYRARSAEVAEIFDTTVTLHTAPAAASHPLLPVIPPATRSPA